MKTTTVTAQFTTDDARVLVATRTAMIYIHRPFPGEDTTDHYVDRGDVLVALDMTRTRFTAAVNRLTADGKLTTRDRQIHATS